MAFDDFDGHGFLLPPYANNRTEDVSPIAEFIAKRVRTLNASFRTSSDTDEKLEIIQAMAMCSTSLSLLVLASFHESQALIDAAKETFRGS